MDSMFVTIRYDKSKMSERNSPSMPGTPSAGPMENPAPTSVTTPNRFIRFQYLKRLVSSEQDDTDRPSLNSSPVNSARRGRAGQPTSSPGANQSDYSELESLVEPEEMKVDTYDKTVCEIPFKNHTEALASLFTFQPNYHAADLSYDQLKDQEWLQDNQVICDRLHLLREVYKAIQSYKKKSSTPVPVGSAVKSRLENENTTPQPGHEPTEDKAIENNGSTNSPEKFHSGTNDTNGESDDVENDSNGESNSGYIAKEPSLPNPANVPMPNPTIGEISIPNSIPMASNYPYNAPNHSFQPQPIPNQMYVSQYPNYNPVPSAHPPTYPVPVPNFQPSNLDQKYNNFVPAEASQIGNEEGKPNVDGTQVEFDPNGLKNDQSENTFIENDMSFASLNKSIDRAIEELDNTKAMSNKEYSPEAGPNTTNAQPEPWYGDKPPANYDMNVLNALNQSQQSGRS